MEICELLVDNNADMEVKNEDGDTPLMLAVRSDQPAVVDFLCKRGCNMHTHGFDNIDPIDYAINKRNLFLSDVLMKHERLHLNSPQTSINEHNNNSNISNSQTKSHNKNFSNDNHDGSELKNAPSLTTLIQEEQEHRQQQEEKNKNANDSLFHSD